MVCKDCKNQKHYLCENGRHDVSDPNNPEAPLTYRMDGTWCDCQHRHTHSPTKVRPVEKGERWPGCPSIQDQVKHGMAVNIVSLP